MHVESVHEGKKPFKCDVSDPKAFLKCILNWFMKEKSHSSVIFVTIAVLKRVT